MRSLRRKYEPRRESKFKNQPTLIDGIHFSSKLEARVYEMLKLREAAGELEDIRSQVQIYFSLRCRIGHRIDFRATERRSKTHVFVEAKGPPTEAYLIKRKLWLAGYGPPGRFEEWRCSPTGDIMQTYSTGFVGGAAGLTDK